MEESTMYAVVSHFSGDSAQPHVLSPPEHGGAEHLSMVL